MNCISPTVRFLIRISVSFPVVVAAVALFEGPQLARAESITYFGQMSVGSFRDTDPLGLSGATVFYEFIIDSAGLTPDFDAPTSLSDWVTEWPIATATASLTITNSSNGGDGSYTPNILVGDVLTLADNFSFGPSDILTLPGFEFSAGGHNLRLTGVGTTLLGSTITASATIHPYEFSASDIVQGLTGNITYVDILPFTDAPVNLVTASAVIPEPSSLILLGIGALGLAITACRHRSVKKS